MTKELADWKEAMAAGAKKAAALPVGGSSGSISTRSGIFTIDGAISKDITVVVLGYMATRKWYEHRSFDADDKRPPVCFAQAIEEEDLVPHANVPDPQGETCADCPHSEWGSRPGSSKAQWCKLGRTLSVVVVDANTTADTLRRATVLSLSVPPTSVKAWDNYASQLGGKGLPPWAASTQVSIAPSKYQFSISFDLVTPLNGDAAIMAQLHAMAMTAEESLLGNAYTYEEEEASADKPKANF